MHTLLIPYFLISLLCTFSIHPLQMYVFDLPHQETLKKEYFLPSLKDTCNMIFASSCASISINSSSKIAKADFILQAIKENWGDFFIYTDLGIQFFSRFESVIQRARKRTLYNEDIKHSTYDLLFLMTPDKGKINAGFFVCSANNRTQTFWKKIKKKLISSPRKTLDTALNKLLLDKEKNPIQSLVFWDFLSLSFYSSNQSLGSDDTSKGLIPSRIIAHYTYNAQTQKEKIARLNTLEIILKYNQKNLLECVNQAANTPHQEKCILLTMLYNETVQERIQEYLNCLETNCAHPYIDTVHVLYDSSADYKSSSSSLKNYLQTQKIKHTIVHSRQTYSDFFTFAQRTYPNRKIIIANADIYFDETLCLLKDYDLTNTFIALSRWEVHSDGSTAAMNTRKSRLCHDSWIYQDPLPMIRGSHILLGTLRCDTKIAYYTHKAGLKVINPSLSLASMHLHQSAIRNYDPIPGKSSHESFPVSAKTLTNNPR